jgi:hypothetical protein
VFRHYGKVKEAYRQCGQNINQKGVSQPMQALQLVVQYQALRLVLLASENLRA